MIPGEFYQNQETHRWIKILKVTQDIVYYAEFYGTQHELRMGSRIGFDLDLESGVLIKGVQRRGK